VGLPWAEVDLAGRSLSVTQQIVRLGYRTESGPPKGQRAAGGAGRGLRERCARTRPASTPNGWPGAGPGSTPGWSSPGRTARRCTRSSSPGTSNDWRGKPDCHRSGCTTCGTAPHLALAGGADLKTVSEMPGHSTITITTADTYASVLPEVAHRAAEAAARLVPRRPSAESTRPGPISAPSGAQNETGPSPVRTKGQVRSVRREGLEPPTR
jgi:hypothetical protein